MLPVASPAMSVCPTIPTFSAGLLVSSLAISSMAGPDSGLMSLLAVSKKMPGTSTWPESARPLVSASALAATSCCIFCTSTISRVYIPAPELRPRGLSSIQVSVPFLEIRNVES
jgi:hypothetical protein